MENFPVRDFVDVTGNIYPVSKFLKVVSSKPNILQVVVRTFSQTVLFSFSAGEDFETEMKLR